jgi:hypothetical protein
MTSAQEWDHDASIGPRLDDDSSDGSIFAGDDAHGAQVAGCWSVDVFSVCAEGVDSRVGVKHREISRKSH